MNINIVNDNDFIRFLNMRHRKYSVIQCNTVLYLQYENDYEIHIT